MNCPVCGAICTHEEIRGEGYTEEEHFDCPNEHYVESFSYGSYGVTIFKKRFGWWYKTPRSALNKIGKNITSYTNWIKERCPECEGKLTYNVGQGGFVWNAESVTCSCGCDIPLVERERLMSQHNSKLNIQKARS